MIDAFLAILGVTVRGLVNRRRILLMLLLSASPVLIALLVRLAGRDANPVRVELAVLDGLVVRTVMPLVALVLGTAALGAELEDGTAVHLLAKPIPRWLTVVAKLAAAAGLTAVLIVPSALVSGIALAGDQGGGLQVAIAYAVAAAVGCLLYTALFLALSVATGRALIIGLVYTLLWEGFLAGLFAGSRAFSIREYTVGIAGLLDPARISAPLDALTSLGGSAAVLVLTVAIASSWLAGYQVRSAD